VTSLDLLFKYLLIMELRFEGMLYSNLGNENSDAGHIKCSRGPHLSRWPQVPHPCFKWLIGRVHISEREMSEIIIQTKVCYTFTSFVYALMVPVQLDKTFKLSNLRFSWWKFAN